MADSLVTISRNKQRKKKKGLDCEYVSLPFRRRGLMKKSSCEAKKGLFFMSSSGG